jgi:hypothetical protein
MKEEGSGESFLHIDKTSLRLSGPFCPKFPRFSRMVKIKNLNFSPNP